MDRMETGNRLFSDLYAIEKLYDKETLSTKLIVQDNTDSGYRVFDSCQKFWDYSEIVPEHLRCFSEIIYENAPQTPKIQVGFSSRTRIPKGELVNIIRQLLSGMLEEFRNGYGDCANVPKSLSDLVVMEESGRNTLGVWSYNYHIQPTTFMWLTTKKRKSLPIMSKGGCLEILATLSTPAILILYNVRYLGTAVDIHRDNLFVNKSLIVDYIDNSGPTINNNVKVDCVPSISSRNNILDQEDCPNELYTDSLRDPQSCLESTHECEIQNDINAKSVHGVVCAITIGETDHASQLPNNDPPQVSPENANIGHEATNTYQDTNIDQDIHIEQSNIEIATGDNSMVVSDTKPEKYDKEKETTITASSIFSRENCLQLEEIHHTVCQTVNTILADEKIRHPRSYVSTTNYSNLNHISSCTTINLRQNQDNTYSQTSFPPHMCKSVITRQNVYVVPPDPWLDELER
ncbi:unnamed protein product [Rhizophagus irregularis]|nr:unnamed protein product [Rhizophagus irregularis]